MCAVTSVNVQATLRALHASLDQVAFGACKLLTDRPVERGREGIQVVPIAPIRSGAAYSRFLLRDLAGHIATSHCLVVQWDGHVLDARRWSDEFLRYDYVGASWPQFDDGHDVGNGGFSLRSRRLMQACCHPDFPASHPEDVAIGRTARPWLEAQGLRFAPRPLADRFSAERAGDLRASFGYHGVFNMPDAIGEDAFWQVYRGLTDRATIRHDFGLLLRRMARGSGGGGRAMRMLADRVAWALGRG